MQLRLKIWRENQRRPDTRQSSCGRLHRRSNANTTHNLKMSPTNGPTDRPRKEGRKVKSRVLVIKNAAGKWSRGAKPRMGPSWPRSLLAIFGKKDRERPLKWIEGPESPYKEWMDFKKIWCNCSRWHDIPPQLVPGSCHAPFYPSKLKKCKKMV